MVLIALHTYSEVSKNLFFLEMQFFRIQAVFLLHANPLIQQIRNWVESLKVKVTKGRLRTVHDVNIVLSRLREKWDIFRDARCVCFEADLDNLRLFSFLGLDLPLVCAHLELTKTELNTFWLLKANFYHAPLIFLPWEGRMHCKYCVFVCAVSPRRKGRAPPDYECPDEA